LTISGYIMLPMAMTVAGPEPDRAAKNAQARITTIAKPPRILPTSASQNSVSRLEMPPSDIRLPPRINSGIAIMEKELSAVKIFWLMTVSG